MQIQQTLQTRWSKWGLHLVKYCWKDGVKGLHLVKHCWQDGQKWHLSKYNKHCCIADKLEWRVISAITTCSGDKGRLVQRQLQHCLQNTYQQQSNAHYGQPIHHASQRVDRLIITRATMVKTNIATVDIDHWYLLHNGTASRTVFSHDGHNDWQHSHVPSPTMWLNHWTGHLGPYDSLRQ